MRWTAANPDPGPMPPAPTEPGPPSSDLAGWAAHHDARAKLTAWVRGWRRHVVAASVDQLENKDRKTPEQQIAYILGVEFLNPSAAPPFGGIF